MFFNSTSTILQLAKTTAAAPVAPAAPNPSGGAKPSTHTSNRYIPIYLPSTGSGIVSGRNNVHIAIFDFDLCVFLYRSNKWGDLGKLVDLSGIARAVKQPQGQINNSFARLDGFSKTPQNM